MMYLNLAPAADLPGEDLRYTSQAPFSLITAPLGAPSVSVAGSGGNPWGGGPARQRTFGAVVEPNIPLQPSFPYAEG